MFDDSHCHLSFPELHERIDDVQREMAAARVQRALCVCTTLEEFPTVHALALRYPNLWCSAGVHPDNEGVTEPSVHDLLERAALPRVVAIGETGLDYYRLGERTVAQMEWQRERFRRHIEASRASGLPLIIHTRSASDDTIAILREAGASHGVFHCFTETLAVARAALELGFRVSFSGIVTFRNAEDLRNVARHVPLDRLLIETDSPYLAPVPKRGKTNTPAYVPFVAQCLAEVKGVPLATLAAAARCNFEQLFGLPPLPTGTADEVQVSV
jgi:TatD DNase family protein